MLKKANNGVELGNYKLTIADLTEEIKEKLIIYGMFVKIQRSSAGKKTEQEKFNAMLETLKTLKEGKWEVRPDPKKAVRQTIAMLEETLKTVKGIPDAEKRIKQRIEELKKQL